MRLGIVLGDQLNRDSALFDHVDVILMAEAAEESTHVWSHKARIALFLSAMRHFRDSLRAEGWQVDYRESAQTLAGELAGALKSWKPTEVYVVEPGDHRVLTALLAVCPSLQILEDKHFLCSRAQFAAHAKGRKQLRMEYFYREMRRAHQVLMDGKDPLGGAWNYDIASKGRTHAASCYGAKDFETARGYAREHAAQSYGGIVSETR